MGWWIRLRRALWLLIAFLTVARPVGAATGTSSQIDQARHQLAVAGATVTQLDRRIAGLDRSITDTAGRVRREREQLRLIARAMYAQPGSVLVAVLGARSLGDALTSFSDLTAAGERAAAAERRLDQDLSTLRAERAALVADRQRADQLRRQLDVLFRVLQAAALRRPAGVRWRCRPACG